MNELGWLRRLLPHATAALGLLANVAAYLLIDNGRSRTIAFYLTSVLGVAVLGLASLGSGMPSAWKRLALGMGAAMAAGALLDLGSRDSGQVIAMAAFAAAGSLLILSGFVAIVRSSSGSATGESRIDAALLAVGGTYAAWSLVIAPNLERSADPGQLISLGLLTGIQAVITWFLLGRLTSGVRFSGSCLYLTSAVLLPLVGLIGATADDPSALSVPGSWIGIVNFSTVWMVAAGGLHPSATQPTLSAGSHPSGTLRMAFVAAALMVPPMVEIVAPHDPSHAGRAVTILMVGLVVGRFWISVKKQGALSREIERARRYFTSLIENSSDPVVVVDADRRVSYASPAARTALGLSESMEVIRMVAEEDRLALSEAIHSAEASGDPIRLEVSRQVGSKVRHYQLTLTEAPAATGVVINAHDVTERVELASNLLHLSRHDPLTGLANRRETMDRMYLELTRRDHPLAALIYVDLDGFKPINDVYGHESGDALLVEVSRRLKASVRPSDTVARFGGDEFVIFCPSVGDEQGAERVATRALKAITRPTRLGQQTVMVGASIGIAISKGASKTPEELLRVADEQMYAAKGRGGARVVGSETHLHLAR